MIFLLILLAVWLMVCLGFYRFQNRLIYDPCKVRPEMAKASVYPGQEIELSPADDPSLTTTSWYWPAQPGRPTILFCHGNNGNMEVRTAWMQFALGRGFGMLMLGYRGYGLNPGQPSQAGLTADALAAFDYLTLDQEIPGSRLIHDKFLLAYFAMNFRLQRKKSIKLCHVYAKHI